MQPASTNWPMKQLGLVRVLNMQCAMSGSTEPNSPMAELRQNQTLFSIHSAVHDMQRDDLAQATVAQLDRDP